MAGVLLSPTRLFYVCMKNKKLRLAQGLGVEFAFPTQTLHIGEQAVAGDRPTSFEAITDAAAQQLGAAKAKEIGGRGT